MVLSQLSYFSRPSAGTTMSDVEDILRVARERNLESCLTGFLLYRHDCFVQVLEGSREAVSRLFCKISEDPRHRDLTIIGCKQIDRRAFTDWSMGFLSLRDASRQSLLRYSTTSEPELVQLDHDSLVQLTLELAEAPGLQPV